MKKDIDQNFPKFEVSLALQNAITDANKAVLELLLVGARESDADPLAGMLLGLSDETLEQFRNVQVYDVINVSKLGAPIFKIRFEDAAVLRTMLQSGFSQPVVMREITRQLPLPEINRQSQQREAH